MVFVGGRGWWLGVGDDSVGTANLLMLIASDAPRNKTQEKNFLPNASRTRLLEATTPLSLSLPFRIIIVVIIVVVVVFIVVVIVAYMDFHWQQRNYKSLNLKSQSVWLLRENK